MLRPSAGDREIPGKSSKENCRELRTSTCTWGPIITMGRNPMQSNWESSKEVMFVDGKREKNDESVALVEH